MLGALADLIGRNRVLLEQTLERVRMLEDGLRRSDAQSIDTQAPPAKRRLGQGH